MICPVCKKDALIVEYSNIELDYCPVCKGVWFDAGELELLLECAGLDNCRSYLDEIRGAAEAVSSEKKHRCPICRRKMKKSYIDEAKKTIVDICNSGHGIWFDGGEVQNLVKGLVDKSPMRGTSQKVLSFVGDMFKYQV